MTAPTLILIGGADDLTPAAHAQPEGAPLALTVYPGAAHAFDVSQFQPGVRLFGHLCEFNEPAARDAERTLRAFLAAHLGNGRNGAD